MFQFNGTAEEAKILLKQCTILCESRDRAFGDSEYSWFLAYENWDGEMKPDYEAHVAETYLGGKFQLPAEIDVPFCDSPIVIKTMAELKGLCAQMVVGFNDSMDDGDFQYD